MNISKETRDNALIIKVEGWLDIQSNQAFAAFVDAIPVQPKLILDLEELEYISSSGLREIVKLILRQPAGTFSITNVRPSVNAVFTAVGLDKKISITAQ